MAAAGEAAEAGAGAAGGGAIAPRNEGSPHLVGIDSRYAACIGDRKKQSFDCVTRGCEGWIETTLIVCVFNSLRLAWLR